MAISKAVSSVKANINRITLPGGTGAADSEHRHYSAFNSAGSEGQMVGTGPRRGTEVSAPVPNGEFAGGSNNQIVAGSNRNTIAGQQSNALQGGQPQNATNAASNNQTGVNDPSNAAGANALAGASCDPPRYRPALLWSGGLGFRPMYGHACGCYVNTGINLYEILLSAVGLPVLFKLGITINRQLKVKSALKKAKAYLKQLTGGRDVFTSTYIRKLRQNGSTLGHQQLLEEAAVAYTREKQKGAGRVKELLRMSGEGIDSLSGTSALAKELDILQLQLFLGSVAGTVAAVAIGATGIWQNASIYRPKVCRGDNTTLNQDTCNCDCDLVASQSMSENNFSAQTAAACYTTGAESFLRVIMQTLISAVPGFNGVFDGDEIAGCYLPCQCLQEQNVDIFGNELCDCICDPDDLPYGNGPCEYERIFDSDTCCCDCPANSHIATGATKGTYARLADNLGNPAPSAYHESYSTGCSYVCDGREANSSNMISPWPPDCESLLGPGAVFVDEPTVCNCMPCQKPDCATCIESCLGITDLCANFDCDDPYPWYPTFARISDYCGIFDIDGEPDLSTDCATEAELFCRSRLC